MLEDKRTDRLDNMRRKYLFYVKNRDRGYMVPDEMKKLFEVNQEGTTETQIGPAVDKLIKKMVSSEVKNDERKFKSKFLANVPGMQKDEDLAGEVAM